MDFTNLFIQALTHPGDHNALRQVNQHAKEILSVLADNDVALSDEQNAILDRHPEWIAQVYDALGEESVDEEEQHIIRELAEARQTDEISVGKAFKNGLIRDLSPHLLAWDSWFGELPRIGKPAEDFLCKRADVQAAQPDIEPLLQFGITPVSLSACAQGVRPVALRWAATRKLPPLDFVLSNDPAAPDRFPEALPLNEVVTSMAAMSASPTNVAQCILDWMMAVCADRHFLFSGFTAQPENDYIRLSLNGGNMTTMEEWDYAAPSAPKQATPSYQSDRELATAH